MINRSGSVITDVIPLVAMRAALMNWRQFSVSHLLVATTATAVLIVVLQVLVRCFPAIYIVVALFSCAIALLGFAILIFDAVLTFSIYASDRSVARRENLTRCLVLAIAGIVMVSQAVLLAFTSAY